jgi:hypothetical protein
MLQPYMMGSTSVPAAVKEWPTRSSTTTTAPSGLASGRIASNTPTGLDMSWTHSMAITRSDWSTNSRSPASRRWISARSATSDALTAACAA